MSAAGSVSSIGSTPREVEEALQSTKAPVRGADEEPEEVEYEAEEEFDEEISAPTPLPTKAAAAPSKSEDEEENDYIDEFDD